MEILISNASLGVIRTDQEQIIKQTGLPVESLY
jgi:hypothetical protein